MLKKVFVSFSCALLIFSVSVLPCFADTVTGSDIIVNTDGTLCTMQGYVNILTSSVDFPIPVNELLIWDTGYDTTSSSSFPVSPYFKNASSFILEEDVTIYWRVAPFIFDGESAVHVNMANINNINTYLPTFYYGAGYNGTSSADNPTSEAIVVPLAMGNATYASTYSKAYRATLPSVTSSGNKVENFSISYPGFSEDDPNGNNSLWFSNRAVGSLMMHIDLFQVVKTTNTAILAKLDAILDKATQMQLDVNNILTACNSILSICQNIEADTSTIVTVLDVLSSEISDMGDALDRVDNNVEAIYYLFSEALSSESEAVKETANNVILEIQENASAETYYQTSMKNTYDQLNIGGWGFGAVQSSIAFVMTVFDDIWDAFGYWTVVFTFPLTMGIAMLVIGRISRFGGGNSSRTNEHKGGEGGA